MALDDFIGDMLDTGASGKRGAFSRVALVGGVLGAGVGAYVGHQGAGIAQAVGYAAIGAFVGWLLGLLLRGFAIFGALFAVALAGVLGWQWITGGLG